MRTKSYEEEEEGEEFEEVMIEIGDEEIRRRR